MNAISNTSIRTRLLVAFIGIILLGFSGLILLAGNQITSSVQADYELRLVNEMNLITRALAPYFISLASPTLSLENPSYAVFSEYEKQVGGTLKFYYLEKPTDRDDNRTNDSKGKPPSSFSSMPEIETALRGETTVIQRRDKDSSLAFYTASSFSLPNDARGILQLRVPSERLQSLVAERWSMLGVGGLMLASIALIAALLLSRSIIKPLYILQESALRLSKGDFKHRVTGIDMTGTNEIGYVARAFNEMADQVESMLEEQRAFASNTSHELRTPLTAIRLRTDALRNDPTLDQATVKAYIAEIDDEAVQLGNLIQDLSLLSRFDAGRATLGNAEIDMLRLAHNLIQQVKGIADEKNIEITLVPLESATKYGPLLLHAGLGHLTVIYRNLLDNALKYTPANGYITWQIGVSDGHVVHTIQDSGRGISAEDLPHIFERFFRADKAHSREIPGSGLGLALVQSIVAAYGATIQIESDGLGLGTTIIVRWPLYHGHKQ